MKHLFKISQTIVSFTAFLLLIACNGNPISTQKNESKQTVYEKILESKTIHVGYISYPPSLIKDPNSDKYSGIFYEVLTEMGRNLDLKIDFVEEVTWGNMIEEVNTGKVDLVCTGIWPNSSRGKLADFTNPIYYSPVKAYVKEGNTNFDGDLSKINSEKVKISVIDGEMTSIIAKYDFPLAKLSGLTQSSDVSQVLLDVASNKAEITFVEPFVANAYMDKNKNTIREVANVNPLRVFPNVMMVAKGEEKFLSMLNISIDELANNGFTEKAIKKYELYPNSFYRRQIPYILNH
jgi:ABC-type amino acid transport substrate-binding protein